MGQEELPNEFRFSMTGIIMFINAFLFQVIAQQCIDAETKQLPDEYEKKHVVKMLAYFSIQWALAGMLNLLNACSPRAHRGWFVKYLYDFMLGAMFGVQLVIFVHYGIGFFVPSQDGSLLIRAIALTLNIIGAFIYLSITWLVCYICILLRKQSQADKKRLLLVSQLQTIPFGRLAFDVEMSCSICLANFQDSDDVVQLRCNHRHIFHKECLRPWIETPSALQPVAVCPLCKREIEFE